MCRSIHPLFQLEPSPSKEEVRAAALQYVRKVSGLRQPSRANAKAFEAAVEKVAGATGRLLSRLTTRGKPRLHPHPPLSPLPDQA